MNKLTRKEEKKIVKLHKKKYRREFGLTLVEGLRAIKQLVNNNVQIEEILVTKDFFRENRSFIVGSFFKKVVEISEQQLNRISTTQHPQAIIGVIKTETKKISDETFILYLEDIKDPGNLGTIIRTAAAAGISGISISPESCDIFNPKVIRASMGMVFYFPIEEHDEDWLKQQNAEVIVTALENSSNIFTWKKQKERIILVIGSEAHGVSKTVLEAADSIVKIPLENNVESLNAAIASGIAIYTLKNNLEI